MLWVKLIDIHPNPNNPRTINADKFAKLKRSLIEFPEMLIARPLVCVTSDFGGYTILGGNQRYRALCASTLVAIFSVVTTFALGCGSSESIRKPGFTATQRV